MNIKKYSKLIILLGIFAAALVFMSQSPLNILLLNGNSGIDSSVFRTIAMQMERGLMPYRDSFDHKGPLLYIYNYLGLLIKRHRGIWIIEFISAFAAFGLMYKTARLKCDRMRSFFVLIICAAPLYSYFEGGNMTEEYALPFIMSAVYIFADYFMNDRITRMRLVICGLGFGAVCMLRVNMIAVWIVFCCAVLLRSFREKRLEEIPRFLLYFLMGAGIIVLPICFWLIFNNAFVDFIKDYFVFNIMYTKDAFRATALNKYNSFSGFANNIYVLTSIVVICRACRDRSLFHIAYLGYEIAGLLMICMSGQGYAHYGMVLVPALVYPFSLLLSKETIREETWILAFVLYFSVSRVIPVWIGGIDKTAEYLLMENRTRERTDAVGQVCTYITTNTNIDEKIIVWGNWNIIYVESERLPASKYSYQLPIGNVDETIMTEFFGELSETLPRIVVISQDERIEEILGFLNEHQYACTFEVDGFAVYSRGLY